MTTDPNDDKTGGHSEEEHPGSVDDPGSVTIDEPTDPALSGTSEDDFGGGEDSTAKDPS